MPNLKVYFTAMRQVRSPMADFFLYTVALTASVKAERIFSDSSLCPKTLRYAA
jgi:hypothetical protein